MTEPTRTETDALGSIEIPAAALAAIVVLLASGRAIRRAQW